MLNSLEIGSLTIAGENDDDTTQANGLVLGAKGIGSVESYLLGRVHMYTQVYLHKTTRSAEKMLSKILQQLSCLIADGKRGKTNLSDRHPLLNYFQDGGSTLENYLALDDYTIWASLPILEESTCTSVSELASRLRNRQLYKCFDLLEQLNIDCEDDKSIQHEMRFRTRLEEEGKAGKFASIDILVDRGSVSPYTFLDFESPDALSMIMCRDTNGEAVDVAGRSSVVKALGRKRFFRIYYRNGEVLEKLIQIREATKK